MRSKQRTQSRKAARWLILILLGCGTVGWSACGSSGGKDLKHPVAQALVSQIEESAALELHYTKSVREIGDKPSQEDSTFYPLPKIKMGERQNGEDSLNYLIFRDLSYLMGKYFDGRYTQEMMELTQQGDTLIAEVKASDRKKAELQLQKIVMSSDSTTLYYQENRLQKRSWLYRMNIRSHVSFDSLGRYQGHFLRVDTKVPLLGQTLKIEVLGKGTY
ncbi:MAG: hypothetical protein AAF804_21990 [Bacteroidota bacterium]